ncbi:hypothetical protein [bacterium endosymbiont of Bathymodiolus sp. 5 South]|jgi:hypothetical protein|uniref:hypothetical protein n=1 Tax=bacterium endosymbiont of Bathymodiolus sp. 5 South TaxID=1181670 RepID=UPI0010B7F81B|nr:hypothetical protein [bacterium endosymbiont of Bathymodiolus sp. 5 South]CAC9635067.1 hypothetical protein [uncultured Gammaproteobacteria bacterium]SHN92945.1 hypothetical protein BCLUESOX_212 [bacterium endosymbiont of Bathymodiolus sp. 5 South]VVH55855.1 hypothetical protein BSPCLSOX_513 [uncultured Gammaproteobacteria bacterium]VVH63332.1 hypothetical protein BSPWISOX_1618 [uncultured Gammaproteobacteria bacterium]VVM26550.1 hypothetical protein BSPWISOXPB_10683 [uncultured Gammaproteo
MINHRVNYLIPINTSRHRNSVAQLITEKAKFLNLVIANESKSLILNATNTLALGASTTVEIWMNAQIIERINVKNIKPNSPYQTKQYVGYQR